jgi:hypothetical protein
MHSPKSPAKRKRTTKVAKQFSPDDCIRNQAKRRHGVSYAKKSAKKIKVQNKKNKTSQQNVTPPAPSIVKNKKKNPAPSCSEHAPAQKLDMVLEALAGAQQEIQNLKQKVEAKEKTALFPDEKVSLPQPPFQPSISTMPTQLLNTNESEALKAMRLMMSMQFMNTMQQFMR